MRTKYTFLFTLCLIVYSSAYTQEKINPCKNTLSTANKEYEAGKFSECIEKLNACLGSFNNNESFEAYRLIALCYLNLKDEKKVNEATINLLRSKPDYKDFPYFDPIEFSKVLAKYDVWPKLEAGIKMGLNLNSVHPIKNYSVTGSDATYLPKAGYQTGVFAEYYFLRNLSLNLELNYESLNYMRTAENVSGWKQEFKESLKYFSIPISGKYYFANYKGFLFGAELGMQLQFMNRTNSNIVLTNTSTNEKIQNTAEQEDQRTKTLYSGLAGLIIKHKLAGGNVGFNIRYAYGFSNVVNPDNRYNNLDFIFANQYVDSDFSFNTLYFNFSYQFPIPGMYAVKLKNK